MPLPTHVTKRGDKFYYVRRVPDDLVAVFGGRPRIQRSLRTADKAAAFSEAAKINAAVERQFEEARAKGGFAVSLQDMSDWTSSDWLEVARWFEARLIQDDLERRLPRYSGRILLGNAARSSDLWSDNKLCQEQIDLRRRLDDMTVDRYVSERIKNVNAIIRRVGVSMLPTSEFLLSFAAACLQAELNFDDVFWRRERGEVVAWPHPDEITGRWRKPRPAEAVSSTAPLEIMAPAIAASRVGKTLADCQKKWKESRMLAKKSVREAYLREMTNTIELFESTQKIVDIGEITRKHVIAFRSHLSASGKYEIATINKKCSFITTLLSEAESHAWIDSAVRGNIHLDVPEDDDNREPYGKNDLQRIFSHRIFTGGELIGREKAGRELQFWLPALSCTHGLISSEIVQLGPDTIVPYPGTDTLCFLITTAGGRTVKELARRRYMPIRREFLDKGLLDLVERARRNGWRTLWSAVEERGKKTQLVASMFSAFWSDFSRRELKITDDDKMLYSFRHDFEDAMKANGTPKHIKDNLMGHAEAGTGRRYGTRRQPEPAPIGELDAVIQALAWPFLEKLVAPRLTVDK